jgi:hypothetical protein
MTHPGRRQPAGTRHHQASHVGEPSADLPTPAQHAQSAPARPPPFIRSAENQPHRNRHGGSRLMRCSPCGVRKHGLGPCSNCGARGGPYDLSGMEFDEVSFVREGANQKAHVVLFKSDDPTDRVVADLEHSIAKLQQATGRVPIYKRATEPDPLALDKAITTINKALGKSEIPQQASVDSLAAVARALQNCDPRLSQAQAISKALEANPGLYDPAMPAPAPVAKQELEGTPELADLASVLQMLDPALSGSQAIAKALETRPGDVPVTVEFGGGPRVIRRHPPWRV